MEKAKAKVIWAIDPFEEKNDTRQSLTATVQELIQNQAQVEPAYVLSPEEYEMNIPLEAGWLKRLKPAAEKAVEQYLKDLKIEGILPPGIVVEKRPSTTLAIEALLAHARFKRADTLLVGTHARKGIQRFFLGSFAETLLLQSKIPVLIVGPSQARIKIEKILFATDFSFNSPQGDETFKKTLTLAKSRNAKVTLFHSLPHAVQPLFQAGSFLLSGAAVSLPEFVSKDEVRKRRAAQLYESLAKKKGVSIETIFNPGYGGVSQMIIDQAQTENTDLIVLSAKSGKLRASLIGSTVRQVVRNAPCPIWVCRSATASKKK